MPKNRCMGAPVSCYTTKCIVSPCLVLQNNAWGTLCLICNKRMDASVWYDMTDAWKEPHTSLQNSGAYVLWHILDNRCMYVMHLPPGNKCAASHAGHTTQQCMGSQFLDYRRDTWMHLYHAREGVLNSGGGRLFPSGQNYRVLGGTVNLLLFLFFMTVCWIL